MPYIIQINDKIYKCGGKLRSGVARALIKYMRLNNISSGEFVIKLKIKKVNSLKDLNIENNNYYQEGVLNGLV